MVVANQLAVAGKLDKKVVQGECCWVLRWVADNQNREKLWWVKGRFLERCGTEAKVQILGKDAPIGRDKRPVPSMVPITYLCHYGDPPTCPDRAMENDSSSSDGSDLEAMR